MVNKDVIASQYQKRGDYGKAAKLYLEHAEEEYKDAEGSYLGYEWAAESFKASAFCYKKLGKFDESKRLFERAIEAFNKSIVEFALTEETYTAPGVEFYVNWTRKRVADIYIQLDEKEKAREIYSRVVNFLQIKLKTYEREIRESELWYGDAGVYCEILAMLYQKLGEYEKAIEYCDKAREYLEKSEQGALIQIHEPYYFEYAKDFVEELLSEEDINNKVIEDIQEHAHWSLKDFKQRIDLRRELIRRMQKQTRS